MDEKKKKQKEDSDPDYESSATDASSDDGNDSVLTGLLHHMYACLFSHINYIHFIAEPSSQRPNKGKRGKLMNKSKPPSPGGGPSQTKSEDNSEPSSDDGNESICSLDYCIMKCILSFFSHINYVHYYRVILPEA